MGRIAPAISEGLSTLGVVVVIILIPGLSWAATHVLCDASSPSTIPFPNDRFTVADTSQNTLRRVNLPKPDCAVRRSDCEDLDVINTLDGFSVQPRLTIPFDGPIDPTTAARGISVWRIGDPRFPPGAQVRQRIAINRLLWDPATRTLAAEPDDFLEQHTQYRVVITDMLRDAGGDAVGISPNCPTTFTTRSTTAFLEKVRERVSASTPPRADFLIGAGGQRAVFAINNISQISVSRQTGAGPSRFTTAPQAFDAFVLNPGTVGQLAFGKYVAADYFTHPGEYISPFGTRTGTPQATGQQEIYFNVYLPAGQQPTGGWPVAIAAPGAAGSKENATTTVAAMLAARGIATIGINPLGLGGGPEGTITVTARTGAPVTLPAGGRGFDQNGDGTIAAREGDSPTAPRTIVSFSHGIQQSVADHLQLVRVIQIGMDIDGDQRTDLDPSRIFFVGNSLGGVIGVLTAAIDENIRASAFVTPAGPIADNNRLSPLQRANIGTRLAARIPSLLNAPGVTSVGGILVGAPLFNENKPLRNQPVVTNNAAGAMEIQLALDWMDWVTQGGSPTGWIRSLRREPLTGSARQVLYYVGSGDQDIPNVNSSDTLAAGDLLDRTIYYRHDVAFAENPTLPKDPHTFGFGFRTQRWDLPAVVSVARAAQDQIAAFFESLGALIVQPQPVRYFESPIKRPLPDGLNYIP